MPTWTNIQDFPAGICITDVTITVDQAVAVRENEFSYRQEVQVFGGERMRMQINFSRQDPETAGKLEAFILKLRGSAGVFRFFDPYHSKPMGRGLGMPKVITANAGEQTVETNGWTPNVSGQLKAGDYLQIGDRLYRSLNEVHSNNAGEATLTVSPSIRENYAINTPVTIHNPTGLFRMDSRTRFGRAPIGQKHTTSLSCVEAL